VQHVGRPQLDREILVDRAQQVVDLAPVDHEVGRLALMGDVGLVNRCQGAPFRVGISTDCVLEYRRNRRQGHEATALMGLFVGPSGSLQGSRSCSWVPRSASLTLSSGSPCPRTLRARSLAAGARIPTIAQRPLLAR